MLPKKFKLVCNACGNTVKLKDGDINEYKLVKKINHNDKNGIVIIRKGLKGETISSDDRKAYNDYFGTND